MERSKHGNDSATHRHQRRQIKPNVLAKPAAKAPERIRPSVNNAATPSVPRPEAGRSRNGSHIAGDGCGKRETAGMHGSGKRKE